MPVLGLACPHVALGPARHVVSEVDLGDEGSTPGAGCGDLQHRLLHVTCDHRAGDSPGRGSVGWASCCTHQGRLP